MTKTMIHIHTRSLLQNITAQQLSPPQFRHDTKKFHTTDYMTTSTAQKEALSLPT